MIAAGKRLCGFFSLSVATLLNSLSVSDWRRPDREVELAWSKASLYVRDGKMNRIWYSVIWNNVAFCYNIPISCRHYFVLAILKPFARTSGWNNEPLRAVLISWLFVQVSLRNKVAFASVIIISLVFGCHCPNICRLCVKSNGAYPIGDRDFCSFSMWAHFLSRAITQIIFGIFTQHFNLPHSKQPCISVVCCLGSRSSICLRN